MPTATVTLGPGDLLYLPFGWWHEVHAEPDEARGGLCASVSHFYHPYHCRMANPTARTLGPVVLNPRYRKLGVVHDL